VWEKLEAKESECKVKGSLGIKEEMKNAKCQVYRGRWCLRKSKTL
jgi:hypothetical protein